MNVLHYATALLEPQTPYILEDHNLTHFTYPRAMMLCSSILLTLAQGMRMRMRIGMSMSMRMLAL